MLPTGQSILTQPQDGDQGKATSPITSSARANEWGKNYVRKEQVQSIVTYCPHCYAKEKRLVEIEDDMRECSQCGSVNLQQSGITKKLNAKTDPQYQFAAENLLQLEEGTELRLRPLDEDTESIRSIETTMSTASSTVSDKFSQIHASATNLTAKSEANSISQPFDSTYREGILR